MPHADTIPHIVPTHVGVNRYDARHGGDESNIVPTHVGVNQLDHKN